MMTRKHYKEIASVIEAHLTEGKEKDVFISRLADIFEKDNPNFIRGKFVHACYWTEAKYKEYLANKKVA
jgi:hypothetical protein